MRPALGSRRAVALLVGPAIVVYVAVVLVPVIWSLGYTFFTGSVISGFQFSGLHNFARIFSDPAIGDALAFTLKYALVMTAGQILLGYLLALFYVFYLRRASTLIRTLVFFPVALPTVAVALLFRQLFALAPVNGLINTTLNVFGTGSISWFGDGGRAFIVIILMDLWTSMGFYAVLLYAGLIEIPAEILESARVDGVGGIRLVWNIVLPLSLPVLISSTIFAANGALKVFDSILALTDGGPGYSTTPLTIYMFRTAFAYGDYGYGSTVALLLTAICLVVTLAIVRTNRRSMFGA